MNPADAAVLLLLAACLIPAVVSLFRQKRKNAGCPGCSGYPSAAACPSCKEKPLPKK